MPLKSSETADFWIILVEVVEVTLFNLIRF